MFQLLNECYELFNPAVEILHFYMEAAWETELSQQARICSQQYILPDQPGLPPGEKRTKEIKQKKETREQSWLL